MSLAAARTDLCFSTLLAHALGQKDGGGGMQSPTWPEGGHPIDLERVMRRLTRRYGSDVRGLEWPLAAKTIADIVDDVEDYYERGAGDEHTPHPGDVEYFYNTSVRGFDVADAWKLTPAICRQEIAKANKKSGKDGFLSVPNASFYRTALRVLNPSLDPSHDDKSQIAWLKHHASSRGVENVILWLGQNNALGTVVSLDIKQTLNDGTRPVDMSHVERARADWNLWHPNDFEAEYRELLKRVKDALQDNKAKKCNVFVGSVPAVTVAPLAKGVGGSFQIERTVTYSEKTRRDRKYCYFKYYTYFPFEEEFAKETGTHLTGQEVLQRTFSLATSNSYIHSLTPNIIMQTRAAA